MRMKPPDLDQWIGAIWSSDASPIASPPITATPPIGLPSSIGALTGSIRPSSLTALPAERRLPDGGSHLVVRLDDAPLWIAETGASSGLASQMPAAALAGVRMRALLRRSARLSCSVGVALKPGATLALFGVPASETAGRHVDLRDLCGGEADRLVEQLRALTSPHARIAAMTTWLTARLRRSGIPAHSATAPSLVALATSLNGLKAPNGTGALNGTGAPDGTGAPHGPDERVAAIARRIGWSQKRLVTFWRERTGLTPKQHQRLLRLRRVLALSATPSTPEWAAVAAECGYSDQAHLCRDFADLTGLTPGEWWRRRGPHPLHVAEPPVDRQANADRPGDDFLQDRRVHAVL